MNGGVEGTNLNTDSENRLHLRVWREAAGWTALVTLLWGTDILARMSVRDQTGIGKDRFRLVSEQVTSGVAVLVMILWGQSRKWPGRVIRPFSFH